MIGVLLLAVAIRLLVLGIGLASVYSAPADAFKGEHPQFNRDHPWVAWDGWEYYLVAQNGYALDRTDPDTFRLIAYFPVIPLIARTLSAVMPLDVALVLQSNAFLMIALAFFYDWARQIAGKRAAAVGVLIIVTFPGVVAFSAGMTEGLFFLLVAMTLWCLQRENFWLAAVVAGVATATRPTGIALAMVIPLCALMRQATLPVPRRLANVVLLGTISVSGLLCYEGFLWHRYKTPFAYFQAQEHWTQLDRQRMQHDAQSGVKRYSWQFFRDRLGAPQAWNHGLALLILIVTLVGFWKPGSIPRLLFLIPLVILLMTSIPGWGLRISSVPRYETGAAPLFLLVAIWLSTRRRTPALVGLVALQLAVQVYYAVLFPREIWVG